MKLTKLETETVINFNDAEKIASVSTRQKSVKLKLSKLGYTPHHNQADYEVYIVPKTCIRFGKPRVFSEESRLAMAERMKVARKAQKTR